MTWEAPPVQPVAWEALPGWDNVPVMPAFAAFLASANAMAAGQVPLRPARSPSSSLQALFARAARMPPCWSEHQARCFFRDNFGPAAIGSGACQDGFLTGYYEPILDGALNRSAHFVAPVLDRPAGATEPMDRAAWEAFALSSEASPVVWLRDWAEVFLVQVQGSARVRLLDGSRCRLVYAGRNGLPYTSIGRRLIETGRIAAADMSLAVLKNWLRSHSQDLRGEARTLMQENTSYIFFRREADPGDDVGPIGGQGVPLRPGSSIAVDRDLWCYGLPFWIDTAEVVPGFGRDPLHALFIAQDTGSAIVGAARADLFLGSGDAAGEAAGRIRHQAAFTVLLPRGWP